MGRFTAVGDEHGTVLRGLLGTAHVLIQLAAGECRDGHEGTRITRDQDVGLLLHPRCKNNLAQQETVRIVGLSVPAATHQRRRVPASNPAASPMPTA